MSSNRFYFIYNGEQIPANLRVKQLGSLPEHIGQELDTSSKYEIKSNVKKENLTLFISYFPEEIPAQFLNRDNIADFYFLSKEFENMKKTKIDTEYSDMLRISFLTSATAASISDISDSEEYIASHLDAFLTLHKSDMYNIPLTSLYNIFFHKKRRLADENLGYHFITDNQTNDSKLFVLLGSLDGTKLNEESLKDSISKKEEHFEFTPRINFGFFENLSQKVLSVESEMAKMRDKQQKLIEENKKVSSMESEMAKMKKKIDDGEAIILSLIKQAPDVGSIYISGISIY